VISHPSHPLDPPLRAAFSANPLTLLTLCDYAVFTYSRQTDRPTCLAGQLDDVRRLLINDLSIAYTHSGSDKRPAAAAAAAAVLKLSNNVP